MAFGLCGWLLLGSDQQLPRASGVYGRDFRSKVPVCTRQPAAIGRLPEGPSHLSSLVLG